jgi:hypothetical protein
VTPTARRQRRAKAGAGRSEPTLAAVVKFYVSSHDFNGLPVRELLRNGSLPAVSRKVQRLVEDGSITVEFGDRHPNPHIKAFEEEPFEVVVDKIKRLGLARACLYPSRRVLAETIDTAAYASCPYKLALALGEPQLGVRYFDPVVLESYRQDPRFHYKCDDIGGRFTAKSDASEKGHLEKSDEVFIENFGFAYNERLDRCVAAFLRYLSKLGPKHQQIWHAHELQSSMWKPHPDWWTAAMGDYPRRISVFRAFLSELRVTNEMCRAIGWPPLYRDDFAEKERPAEFAFLLRPTVAAFNAFIHLLDKLMSENLSKEFFRSHDVPLETERHGKDGRVRVENRGTIKLLEEWLLTKFHTADESPLRRAIEIFREVRTGRQKPAHGLDENRYDPSYYAQQRELMQRAYGAVRVIRLVLACHPDARSVEVPRSLQSGDIWFA